MVPAPSTVVHRHELVAELVDHLLDRGGGGAGGCVAVEGAGGFGKTTLAAVVCQRADVRDRYPGGLVWVTVGEQASGAELADLVNGVTEVLTGVRPTMSEPMWAGAALGEALDGRPDTLIVLDDVWTANQLSPFLLGGAHCCRLVTTRNRGVVPRGTPSVVVDTMTPEQAAEVLQLGLGRPLAADLLEPLVDQTGRWPVLLGLVNATMHDRITDGATAEEAAAWLADRLKHAGPTALDVGDELTRYRAVATTIAVSLDQLSAHERDLYWLLAIFPENTDVPSDVLAVLWQASGSLTAAEAEAVRERLVRLRLVIGSWVGEQPAVRVHDVIREYLRRRMGDEQRAAAHRRFLDVVRRTLLPPAGGSATPWWDLPRAAAYFWRFVPWHLQEAGDHAGLAGLITDLRWTVAKAEALGAIGPVETDLALLETEVVRTLRRAIAQNAHVLSPLEPGDGLGPTLVSRLRAAPDLEPIVDAFTATLKRPHLVNRWPLPDLPAPSTQRILSGRPSSRSWVMACAVSPSGELIVASGMDGTVRVWRTDTWALAAVMTGHAGPVHDCAFTVDGTAVVTAGDDGTVRLWDARTGHQRRIVTEHGAAVTSVCVVPDGTAAASTALDGTVHVSDLVTERRRLRIDGRGVAFTGCAVSPDGRLLVTAGADGSLCLWDAATGGLVGRHQHPSELTSCAISADGRLVAVTTHDGAWSLCELPGLHRQASVTGHTGRVAACAFSPDGRLLATAGHDEQSVRIWDVATGRSVETLVGHPGYVRDCTFTPDGTRVVSAGADQTTVWNLTDAGRSDTRRAHPGWVWGCASSPDGRWLVTGGTDRILRLWETETGRPVRSLAGHGGAIRSCVFSPGGRRIASSADDRTVRLWSLLDGKEFLVLTGHEGAVMGCAFSPDGRYVASGSEDHLARVWDTHTGGIQHVLAGHTSLVKSCAFSPDGASLATTSADQTVRLWDLGTGHPRAVLHGHEEWVNACCFTRDGRRLVTCSGDRTTRIWDLATGRTARTLAGHTHWISGCALSGDDRRVATASADRTIRIWDSDTGRCLTALRVGAGLASCAWIDGSTIGAAGDAGVYAFTLRTDDS